MSDLNYYRNDKKISKSDFFKKPSGNFPVWYFALIVIFLLLITGVGLSAWDYIPPKPAKDMSGEIVIVPVSVYKEYGFSLETTCFYNLRQILLALKVTQAEVLALKDRIKVLESQVRTLIEKEINDGTQERKDGLQEQARPQEASEEQEERS